jgi:hypothetical protein
VPIFIAWQSRDGHYHSMDVALIALLGLWALLGVGMLIRPRVVWLQVGRPMGRRPPLTRAQLAEVPDGAVLTVRAVGCVFVVMAVWGLWSTLTA